MCFAGLIEWLKLEIGPNFQLFDVEKVKKSKFSKFRLLGFWDHQTDAENSGELESKVEIDEI